MFGTKLRAQINSSSRQIAGAINAQTHVLDKRLKQQAQQTSRIGNASEIQNDLKLIEMGYSSSRDIPLGTKLHGLWEPQDKKDREGIERWCYNEATVTYDRVTFDEKIEMDMLKPEARYNLMNEKARVEYLGRIADRNTFHLSVNDNDYNASKIIMFKARVVGFWDNVETKILYSPEFPRWWKTSESAGNE